VFKNAPELLARLLVISDRIAAVLDDRDREAIAETLVNIRDTTGVFARRTPDIDQTTLIDWSSRQTMQWIRRPN
jgi:hypothetical protein